MNMSINNRYTGWKRKRRIESKGEAIHTLSKNNKKNRRESAFRKIPEAPKTHKNKNIIVFLKRRKVNQQTTLLLQRPLHLSLFNFLAV